MRKFDSLLAESVKLHGHLCPGQVLGVRMSMLGLRETDIIDPRGKDRKDIIVFVEMDRCATDAVQSVTGCSLGHRTMKFMDYGKMAATFLNLRTGKAVRVVAKEESRQKAKEMFPGLHNKYEAQTEAYKIMSDDDLFKTMEVEISLKPQDMPGRPMRRVACESCGEYVQDMREEMRDNKVVCRHCADGGYYTFFAGSAMQNSHNGYEIRSKLWLEINGAPVFGKGRRILLDAIDRYGSINQAAREISISYRKAWGYIKAMEERLGIKLVERHAGGKNGGGAALTSEARDFIKKYEELERGLEDSVNRKFAEVFHKTSLRGGNDV